jgi:hypothetical protein
VPRTTPAKLPSGWLKRRDSVTIHSPVLLLRTAGPTSAPREADWRWKRKYGRSARLIAHQSRRCQPVAVFVGDDEAVYQLRAFLARNKNLLEFPKHVGRDAFRFKAAQGAEYAGVQEIETVFNMLGERAGQIAHGRFGDRQTGLARGPLLHRSDGHDRGADQHHKDSRPERQPIQAGFAVCAIDRARFLHSRRISRLTDLSLKLNSRTQLRARTTTGGGRQISLNLVKFTLPTRMHGTAPGT